MESATMYWKYVIIWPPLYLHKAFTQWVYRLSNTHGVYFLELTNRVTCENYLHSSSLTTTMSSKVKKMTCSRCGERGHRKNMKVCPLYYSNDRQSESSTQSVRAPILPCERDAVLTFGITQSDDEEPDNVSKDPDYNDNEEEEEEEDISSFGDDSESDENAFEDDEETEDEDENISVSKTLHRKRTRQQQEGTPQGSVPSKRTKTLSLHKLPLPMPTKQNHLHTPAYPTVLGLYRSSTTYRKTCFRLNNFATLTCPLYENTPSVKPSWHATSPPTPRPLKF